MREREVGGGVGFEEADAVFRVEEVEIAGGVGEDGVDLPLIVDTLRRPAKASCWGPGRGTFCAREGGKEEEEGQKMEGAGVDSADGSWRGGACPGGERPKGDGAVRDFPGAGSDLSGLSLNGVRCGDARLPARVGFVGTLYAGGFPA